VRIGHKFFSKAVSFDVSTMWVDFVDGRKLGVPLAYFPRLLNATSAQREHYEIDEGISVENLLLGIGDRTGSHLMAA
jgi:hypothetical protein